MTEAASKIETPEDMNNGKNIPEQAAIAAKAPPMANDPVPPMDTDALYRLWSRNPKQAPAIEAPKIERSGRTIKSSEQQTHTIFTWNEMSL